MKYKFTFALVLMLVMAVLMPTGASAAVLNVQGDVVEIGAPASVSEGDLESNDDVVVFSESENVALADGVYAGITEPGAYSKLSQLTLGQIPAGTSVNSYLLHSDRVGQSYYSKTFQGSVEFEEEILGIIVTGIGLIITDDELGASGTDYSNGIFSRGAELYFGFFDRVTLSEDMRTVTVKFKTSKRVDQIRVVTLAEPEPVNDPPVLDPIGSQSVTEGDSLDVNISASDPNADTLAFSFTGLPNFATFTPTGNGTGTLSFNPNSGDAGIYNITVNVSDGELSDSETFALTVDELVVGGLELPTAGLIGYWPFDEGSGPTAADSTINGNDGVLTGNPTWIGSGLAGGAISFDGLDDFVTMGDQAAFDLSEYTWSIWVNSPTSPVNGPTTQPLSNADMQFTFSWDHNKVKFVGSAAHGTGGEQFLGSQMFSSVSTNTWHNIVGTYDGGLLRIYLDGALHEVTAGTAPMSTAGPLQVGAGLDAALNVTNFFPGSVDELRIYNRALSVAEVDLLSRQGSAEIVDLNSALTAYWAFDDGVGQIANDSGVDNLDGTLGADALVSSDDPTWIAGRVGSNALSFDGVDDFVTVGDQPQFQLPVYSWSLWVNASAPPGTTSVTQPLSNADQQFVMSWDHPNGSFTASAAHGTGGGSFVSAQIGSNLMANTWYHVSATFDGANLRIYLDGVLEQALFVGGGPVAAPGPLHIGAGVNGSGGPSVFFDGSIDDVRVYGRVLNSAEVAVLSAQ